MPSNNIMSLIKKSMNLSQQVEFLEFVKHVEDKLDELEE